MKYTVYDRLLQREIGQAGSKYTGVHGVYGDRQWVEDMDIVNELEGHTGCVNALCWSKSGRLLASGSDDHRINIHAYHPDSSTSQFSLTTSILTGHRTNIFSVKFMPYSNDRTIVSATDDVRIFDIERTGHSLYGSSSSATARRSQPRRAGIHGVPDAVVLTEGDTNAKAFRCHTDTVKRIVTEDTPFYFLTCSEDGDVRQWDIRQPPKTYPPARDRNAPAWARDADASDNVPPPLISYSRYNLDLNTVSCSPSQPHYIALGGAHLHCFLHDRRMLGRDKLRERGGLLSSPSSWDDKDELAFSQATRCVKKFAPNGQQRMGRRDSGHITACKISDADPNEIIVSWSGDWIYSFDMMRAPDATEKVASPVSLGGERGHRVKDKSRKRKRRKASVLSEEAADRAASRQRTESAGASASDASHGLALRVNYGNGQSEEIRIAPPERSLSESEAAALRDTDHYRLARTTIKIQKQIFTLDPNKPNGTDVLSSHRPSFTSILGFAASILPEMDEISRAWGYPMDPNEVDVALQNKLRDQRAAARRFVQAAGTLARVLGGQLRTGSGSDAIISRYFATIQPSPNERRLPPHEQFGYDFLKAILLWLDSGLGALVEGFSSAGMSARLPLRPDADVDAVDETLIPYLLSLASDRPILRLDASRFERDERRVLFTSERDAVLAFASAIKVPFADLSAQDETAQESSTHEVVQERGQAKTHWGFIVGRGVLWNAARDIRFSMVDRAFGGLGVADASIRAEEHALRENQADVDPNDDDSDVVIDAEIVTRAWDEQSADRPQPSSENISLEDADGTDNRRRDAPSTRSGHSTAEESEEEGDEDEDDDDDDDSDGDLMSLDEDDDDDDDDEDVDDEGLSRTRSGRILWRSDFDRSHLRERVEARVPCAPHTKVFKGHCNVRTVKDVNYFGLQDEYVVSGSDSGHVFIWDRKTSQLLNILEGDGEVVNVVQGHPYEPTMAVSGIDHTIKIFSPDAHEQRNARLGIGVRAADPGFSSLGFGSRRRGRTRTTSETSVSNETSQEAREHNDEGEDDDEEERVAPHGLRSRKRMHLEYEITSKNDMDRKGGREDAFITRALLAQLAQRMHAHHHNGGDPDEDGEGGTIILNSDDGCEVM